MRAKPLPKQDRPTEGAWQDYAFALTIDLTPSRDLSLNGGIDWRKRNNARQAVEKAAQAAISNLRYALDFHIPDRWDSGIVTITVVVAWERMRKPMDHDNLRAALKPYQDCVARAVGRDDRYFQPGRLEQVRDLAGLGWVRIELERVVANDQEQFHGR